MGARRGRRDRRRGEGRPFHPRGRRRWGARQGSKRGSRRRGHRDRVGRGRRVLQEPEGGQQRRREGQRQQVQQGWRARVWWCSAAAWGRSMRSGCWRSLGPAWRRAGGRGQVRGVGWGGVGPGGWWVCRGAGPSRCTSALTGSARGPCTAFMGSRVDFPSASVCVGALGGRVLGAGASHVVPCQDMPVSTVRQKRAWARRL